MGAQTNQCFLSRTLDTDVSTDNSVFSLKNHGFRCPHRPQKVFTQEPQINIKVKMSSYRLKWLLSLTWRCRVRAEHGRQHRRPWCLSCVVSVPPQWQCRCSSPSTCDTDYLMIHSTAHAEVISYIIIIAMYSFMGCISKLKPIAKARITNHSTVRTNSLMHAPFYFL